MVKSTHLSTDVVGCVFSTRYTTPGQAPQTKKSFLAVFHMMCNYWYPVACCRFPRLCPSNWPQLTTRWGWLDCSCRKWTAKLSAVWRSTLFFIRNLRDERSHPRDLQDILGHHHANFFLLPMPATYVDYATNMED